MNEKNHQMALQYKNIKNNYQNNDISTIHMSPGVPGLSKNSKDQNKDHFGEFDCLDSVTIEYN